MTIDELATRFLKHARRDLSASTHTQYASKLRPFRAQFGNIDLVKLDANAASRAEFAEDFEDYLERVWSRPNGDMKSPDTCRMYYIVPKTMFAWARDRGHVVATLIPKVDLPAGRRRERLPTDEETERILREAKPDFAVIYRALRQCGARPGELAAATMDDILGGEIVLKKHKTSRKSGRARRIWIGEKLQALIDQATSGRTTGPIFVDQRGRSWTVQRLSRRFRTIRNRLELSRELVLYTTRHEHATKICAAHGIYVAQQALGHASIKTTQRYVNVDPDQQRSAQDDV